MGATTSEHSPQVGWMVDGFPIYGPRGPDGQLMKRCSVTGGTEGDGSCVDECGGMYYKDSSIDEFVYRYYFLGDTSDGLQCDSPGAYPGEEFFPHSPNCLRGCCPEGISCTKISACSDDAIAGVTDDYEAEAMYPDGMETSCDSCWESSENQGYPEECPTPEPTDEPSWAPTAAAERCESYCPTNGNSWDSKCTWAVCRGCEQCYNIPSTSPSAAPTPRGQPNILLLISDDYTWDTTWTEYRSEFSGKGNLVTPNIESLRADSLIFSRAFTTSPHCAPARWALLTGRYVSTGSEALSRDASNNLGYSDFLTAKFNSQEQSANMASVLQNEGYYTCFVGKWHLNSLNNWWTDEAGSKALVEAAGFDFVDGLYLANIDAGDGSFSHTNEWATASALKCIENAIAADKPYFLWFAPTPPHTPNIYDAMCSYDISHTPYGSWNAADYPTVSSSVRTSVCDGSWTGATTTQRLGTAWVDESTKDIVNYLQQEDVYDSTAFFWMMDHGTEKNVATLEAAWIALTLRYPPVTNGLEGTVNDGIVSQLDISATVFEIAGVDDPGYDIFGLSLLDSDLNLLTFADRTILFEYQYDRVAIGSTSGGDLNFVIEDADAVTCTGYNALTDPSESTDTVPDWLLEDYEELLNSQRWDTSVKAETTCIAYAPTTEPSYQPTGASERCENYCERNTNDWSAKCNWQVCTGCEACHSTTDEPTSMPVTSSPTASPTPTAPSQAPSGSPTSDPTSDPTDYPSFSLPSQAPSRSPTSDPTSDPTDYPSFSLPSQAPSRSPTSDPTSDPTSLPSISNPSKSPSPASASYLDAFTEAADSRVLPSEGNAYSNNGVAKMSGSPEECAEACYNDNSSPCRGFNYKSSAGMCYFRTGTTVSSGNQISWFARDFSYTVTVAVSASRRRLQARKPESTSVEDMLNEFLGGIASCGLGEGRSRGARPPRPPPSRRTLQEDSDIEYFEYDLTIVSESSIDSIAQYLDAAASSSCDSLTSALESVGATELFVEESTLGLVADIPVTECIESQTCEVECNLQDIISPSMSPISATDAPEPVCEDGEMDNSDPCEPKECVENDWVSIIVDCAEQMGMECLAGWMPAVEGTCCSTCPCDDIMCTMEVCSDGSNPPVPEGECCGDMSLCPTEAPEPTEPVSEYLVPDEGLLDSMMRVLQRDYTVARLRSAGQRAAALLQEKDEDGNKVAPLYDPAVKGYLQKIRRFFKADESTYSEEIYGKQRNQYNNIAEALGREVQTWE